MEEQEIQKLIDTVDKLQVLITKLEKKVSNLDSELRFIKYTKLNPENGLSDGGPVSLLGKSIGEIYNNTNTTSYKIAYPPENQ